MDRPSLIDHVPALLQGLADRAEALHAGRTPPSVQPEATAHAFDRLEHGYDLDEVLAEYALLRRSVIQRCLQDAPELGPADLLVVHEAFDQAIVSTSSRFSRLREQTLSALDRISAAVLGSPEVDELLEKLLDVFRGVGPIVDSLAILLLDGDRLYVRATFGLEEDEHDGRSLAIGEGFAGRVAAERKPLLLHEASKDPLLLGSATLRARATRALYGVPLEHGGRLLGVAHMGSRIASEFSNEELVLFRAMAERAAAAISHSEYVTREQVGHAVAAVLASASSLEEALPNLLARIGETCGWGVGSAWLLDPEERVLRHYTGWTAASISAPAFLALSRQSEFHPGEGLPGRTLQAGEAIWLSDISLAPNFLRKAAALQEGLRSAVALPLKVGKRVLGVLEFFSDRLRSPADTLVRITTVLADQLEDFVRRLEAQEQVRRSEHRFRLATRATSDAIWSWDLLTDTVEWSEGVENLSGDPPAELGPDPWQWIDRIHPADRERVVDHIQAVIDGSGDRWADEYLFRHRDGGYRRVTDRGIVERDPRGRAVRMVGAMKDVTAQHAAELALRTSEERLRLALESASLGTWDFNPTSGVLHWDQRSKEIFGLSPDAEASLDTLVSRIHPEHREEAYRTVWRAFESGGTARYEFEFRTVRLDDGVEHWVHATCRAVVEQGRAARFIGTNQDITVIKAAEAALQRSEREFRLLTEAMPQLVWTAQADGRLDYVNPRLAEYLGDRADAFLASNWEEVIHPDDRAAFEPAWAHAVAAGQPFQVERRLRRTDGTYRWFLTRGVPIRDGEGRVYKWLGTSTDIDDLKRAEAELRVRSEVEQQLIGIVSHDLRNPLHVIRFSAQSLLRTGGLGDREARTVQRLNNAAERATRLTRDLLEFTRIRLGGGVAIMRKPLDFHDAVRSVLEEIRTAHPQRVIELRSEGDGQGAWDADRIAQIVTNLVNNAISYSAPDTPICVETRAEGSLISLSVHNQGAPISPALLPHLFEPLRRGAAEDAEPGNIGLGLFIVRSIVRAHGGDVEVQSTAEEGTTFRVLLPRAAEGTG